MAETAAAVPASPSLEDGPRRVTTPQPFHFHLEERAESADKEKTLSTDELRMLQAEEEAKMLRASKSPQVTPRRKSQTHKLPSLPVTEPKPFHFRSGERHKRAQENSQDQANSAWKQQPPAVDEDPKKLAEARVQRTRDYIRKLEQHKEGPPKPAKTVTVPRSPRFSSEARIQYHHQVLDPQKRVKEDEMKKEKILAEKKRQDEEAEKVREYRRNLVHKPREVPDFNRPVEQPNFRGTIPVTKAREPKLATTARLGPRMYAPESGKLSPAVNQCNPQQRSSAAGLRHHNGKGNRWENSSPAEYSVGSSTASLPDYEQGLDDMDTSK